MGCNQGDPVQFEFTSADATTAAPLVLRDAGGGVHTLNPLERLILQTMNVMAGAGTVSITIFDDANANGLPDLGERMLIVGEGFANVPFVGTDAGASGGKGRVPMVKAAGAGTVAITGIGVIIKG